MIYDPEVALIAKHQRETRGKACLIEDTEHRRFKRRRYGLASIQETFVALGEGAQAFLEGLIARGPRQAGYIARQILCLRETWHSQDIAAALSHASTYHAYNLKAVQSILNARSQPRQLERTPAVKAAQEQLTRLPAITQRSLQAYEGFLDQGANHE
jgi:hypothetical protein